MKPIEKQDKVPATARVATTDLDVVVVGAGFAGLCMLYRLRKLGLTTRVFEAAPDVGGTWYWNRYPGARVDIESVEYSFSFSEELQQEWQWSERYSPQPELLRYANHVADRFDLRRDIQLETRVTAAAFDETTNRWVVETDRGDRVSARFCIMASGLLSAPKPLDIKGADSFKGARYHTAQWPKEPVDFTGKRVGVIGTGSSGVQCIPVIAQQAGHLHVFQRTPVFSIPARNAPMDPAFERQVKDNYAELRQMERDSFAAFVMVNGKPTPFNMTSALAASAEEREREYESRWQNGGLAMYTVYSDILLNKEANDTAADFLRGKIREKVRDPVVAEKLVPQGFPLGTKRICADNGYYETYNRDNVTLIDVNEKPIEEITPKGVRTGGIEYELDILVTATGFDAVTGALSRIDIRGRGGRSLRDKWADGPRALLGIMTAGFPNLYTIGGAGSTSSLTQSITAIEYHTQWIADSIEYLRRHDRTSMEPTLEAEGEWVDLVNTTADQTLFPLANSWYMGANVPGKPRVVLVYLGPFNDYTRRCDAIAATGYKGFSLGSASSALSTAALDG